MVRYFCIVCILLIHYNSVQSQAGEGDVPEFGRCGGQVLVSEEENATYSLNSAFNASTSKYYPPGTECAWEFIGDPTCTVQLECAVLDFGLKGDAKKNCEAKDEHLEVSDGTGGLERFCDKTVMTESIVSSKGLRDLYIRYKSSSTPQVRNGFKCTIKCTGDAKSVGRPLKITQERDESKTCVCGMKKNPPTRRKRIVHGFEAGLNEWPWQVALVYPGTRTSFCGGAILNSRYILTAAHCTYFAKLGAEDVEILIHARQLDRTDRKLYRQRNPDPLVIALFKEKLKIIQAAGNFTGALGKIMKKPTLPGIPGGTPDLNITDKLKPPKLPLGTPNLTAPDLTKTPVLPGTPNLTSPDLLKPPVTKIPVKKLLPTLPPLVPKGGGLGGIGGRRRRKRGEDPPFDPITNELNKGLIKLENQTKKEETFVTGGVVQNLTDIDEHTRRFKVAKITNHPLFTSAYDFDVAVVELATEIDLQMKTVDDHTSLCLPPLGYNETFYGVLASVVGWGLKKEDDNITDGSLSQNKVIVMQNRMCQNWTEYEITTRMMCAGYEEGEKDACVGDSGGPLNAMNSKNQWMQIGIVSWGEGCAKPRKPGIYSRVTELQQWVLHRTFNHGKWCRNE